MDVTTFSGKTIASSLAHLTLALLVGEGWSPIHLIDTEMDVDTWVGSYCKYALILVGEGWSTFTLTSYRKCTEMDVSEQGVTRPWENNS